MCSAALKELPWHWRSLPWPCGHLNLVYWCIWSFLYSAFQESLERQHMKPWLYIGRHSGSIVIVCMHVSLSCVTGINRLCPSTGVDLSKMFGEPKYWGKSGIYWWTHRRFLIIGGTCPGCPESLRYICVQQQLSLYIGPIVLVHAHLCRRIAIARWHLNSMDQLHMPKRLQESS